MDNFDLKKYLTEGRIYEEDKEVKTWWIHKFTNKQTGDTYYSPSSLRSDPNSALKHMVGTAKSHKKQGKNLGDGSIFHQLLQYGIGEYEAELVATSNSEEYKDDIYILRDDDPKSIGNRVGGDGGGAHSTKKRIDPIGQELIDAGTMDMTNKYIIIPTSAHNQEQSKYFQNLNPARAKEFGNQGVVIPLKTKSKEHKLLTRNDWRILAQNSPGFVVYDFQQLQGIIDGLQTK